MASEKNLAHIQTQTEDGSTVLADVDATYCAYDADQKRAFPYCVCLTIRLEACDDLGMAVEAESAIANGVEARCASALASEDAHWVMRMTVKGARYVFWYVRAPDPGKALLAGYAREEHDRRVDSAIEFDSRWKIVEPFIEAARQIVG